MIQEALTNVEKHARAKKVTLEIACRRGKVVVKIQDDGRGFARRSRVSEAQVGRGIGLANLRERSGSMGGTCEIASVPGRGTLVTILVPCGQEK
jgi:signal transduction histidine kinase